MFSKKISCEIKDKRKKRFYEILKRFFINKRPLKGVILLFSILALTDFYFEALGLPPALREILLSSAERKGIYIKADSVKFGLVRGIILDGVIIRDGLEEWSSRLKAKNIRAGFSLLSSLMGRLKLEELNIKQAELSIPLFPEAGREGESDRIMMSNFNCHLFSENESMKIKNCNFQLQDFVFDVSGQILNMPELTFTPLLFGEAYLGDRNKISLTSYINKIPFESRAKAMKSLLLSKEIIFSSAPHADIKVSLDAADVMKSKANGKVEISSFKYDRFESSGIRGSISMDENQLTCKDLKIFFPGGDNFTIKGLFNPSKLTLSGTVKGRMHAERLLNFFRLDEQEQIINHFDLPEKELEFSANLHSYYLPEGSCSGKINIKIPRFSSHGVKIKSIDASILLGTGSLKSEKIIIYLAQGGRIQGSLTLDGDNLQSNFQGRCSFRELQPSLMKNDKLKNSQLAKLFEDNSSNEISFTAGLSSSLKTESIPEGTLLISVPSLQAYGLSLKNISAQLEYDGKKLNIDSFRTVLENGGTLSGNASFLPSENYCSGSVKCSGKPLEILSSIPSEYKNELLEELIQSIEIKNTKSKLDANVDFTLQNQEKPVFLLKGNVVVTDFIYNYNSFSYGVIEFMADSGGLLVIPGMILENPNGQALFSFASDTRASDDNEPSLPVKPDKAARGLSFSLKSTLPGNTILRCIYKEWGTDYVSFDGKASVKAAGLIDFEDSPNTRVDIDISNAEGSWNGIPITNIDTSVSFKGKTMTILNAKGDVCKGKMIFNDIYNFNTEKGKMWFTVKGADLRVFLRDASLDNLSDNQDKISGEMYVTMDTKFRYDKDNQLFMDGGGKIIIEDAQIWSLPLFAGMVDILGSAWSIEKLGRISRLTCDYKLDGDSFKTSSIKTDGGVVALEADGSLCWHNSEFSFDVSAKLLKNVLPFKALAYLLSPVSWLFKKRVHGKGRDIKWD